MRQALPCWPDPPFFSLLLLPYFLSLKPLTLSKAGTTFPLIFFLSSLSSVPSSVSTILTRLVLPYDLHETSASRLFHRLFTKSLFRHIHETLSIHPFLLFEKQQQNISQNALHNNTRSCRSRERSIRYVSIWTRCGGKGEKGETMNINIGQQKLINNVE